MSKPIRCTLGLHRYTWVGPPGALGSYRECRRCKKVRKLWGPDATHDFSRSGMDEKSQDPRTWGM
jgi:hypothetical protein